MKLSKEAAELLKEPLSWDGLIIPIYNDEYIQLSIVHQWLKELMIKLEDNA